MVIFNGIIRDQVGIAGRERRRGGLFLFFGYSAGRPRNTFMYRAIDDLAGALSGENLAAMASGMS
ncbi:MAG: hypothetical protein C3F11_01645 [Methylocystaceae bacterium]|nr:MAG: hypothetical protein C3F11_01645 [Methylocystaceae bacterium]